MKKKLFIAFLAVIALFAVFFTINYFQKKQIYDNINKLRSDSINERVQAVESLVKIGKPAVEPLVFAVRYDSSHAKSSAASFLSSLFKSGTVQGIAQFTESESQNLIVYGMKALARIGDSRAVLPMIAVLKKGNERMGEEAFCSLIKFDNILVKPLIELCNDKNPHVRKFTALLLGNTKSPEAVQPLIDLLNDGDADVNESAVIALGKLGKHAYGKLVEKLDDKSESVRMSAFKALGRSSDPRAIEILLKPEKHKKLVTKVLPSRDYEIAYRPRCS